jgi:hypothetical protein
MYKLTIKSNPKVEIIIHVDTKEEALSVLWEELNIPVHEIKSVNKEQ